VTGEDVKQEFINNNELIKFEYAVLFKDQMRDPEIANDTSEVLEYYENNKDRYFKPAEAELKYVELKKIPTESDSLAAKQQARSISEEILDAADFAQLAMDFSDDVTAPSGGDLGWFGEDMIMEGFGEAAVEAAFALSDSGDISEPVRTEYGWHVIMKTGERSTDDGATEIKASHILSKIALSGQTVTDLRNTAQMFLELTDESGFDAAAGELGIEVGHTAGFVEGNLAGTLREAPRVNEFAFSSKVGDVSRIMEDPERIVVAELEKLTPEGVPPFDECFGRANTHLTQKKLGERAFAGAQEIYDLVVAGSTIEEAAAQVGAEYYVSPMMSRRGKTMKIGDDPNFLGIAFRLSEQEPLSKPIVIDRGAAVVRFLERQAPNLELFTVEQDSIHSALLSDLRDKLSQEWYTSMLETSEIEDYRHETMYMY
jgi:peptidyl-prolyl cis-trans isomerase D